MTVSFMRESIVQALVLINIVSHEAIFVMDYTQYVPLVDFIKRHDGTPSDRHNLLPLELCYCGITAMGYGTIAFSYLLATFGIGTYQSASLISLFFHGTWIYHMQRYWTAWQSMIHPDGSMSPGIFFHGHVAWFALSFAILAMRAQERASRSVARNKLGGAGGSIQVRKKPNNNHFSQAVAARFKKATQMKAAANAAAASSVGGGAKPSSTSRVQFATTTGTTRTAAAAGAAGGTRTAARTTTTTTRRVVKSASASAAAGSSSRTMTPMVQAGASPATRPITRRAGVRPNRAAAAAATTTLSPSDMETTIARPGQKVE